MRSFIIVIFACLLVSPVLGVQPFMNAGETGTYGIQRFLLYQYTKDPAYLIEAHRIRHLVNRSDACIYWRLFAINKENMQENALHIDVDATKIISQNICHPSYTLLKRYASKNPIIIS